jgi:phospholipid transport system substrate-binding protein
MFCNRWIVVAVLVVSATTAGADAPPPGPTSRPTTRPAPALDPNAPPEQIVRVNWQAIVDTLRDDQLDPNAKKARIERIATPRFDFPLMARLAAGRRIWMQMTPAQRARYVKLFTRHLKSSYRGKIELYEGERVRFPDPDQPPDQADAPRRRRANLRKVTIHLVSPQRDLAVVHKFRHDRRRWMIYDVEIEGVSIVLSYRSQFEDLLAGGGIENLLTRLQETLPR